MMIVEVYIVWKTQIQVRIVSNCFFFLWKVRAASVTCFAGITSSVFSSLVKEKQDFILSSLVSFGAMCNCVIESVFALCVVMNGTECLC
jgi:hypothetical protein